MRILSVTPTGENTTTISTVQDGHYVNFVYSEVYELIRDPFNPQEWCQWNGGTLTEAISWVIALYMPSLAPEGDY